MKIINLLKGTILGALALLFMLCMFISLNNVSIYADAQGNNTESSGNTTINSVTLTNVPTKYKVSGGTYTAVNDAGETVGVEDITIASSEAGQYTIRVIVVAYDGDEECTISFILVRAAEKYEFVQGTTFSLKDSNGVEVECSTGCYASQGQVDGIKSQFGLTDVQIGDVVIYWLPSEYSSTPSGSNDSTIVTLTSFTIPTSLNMNEKTSVIFPEYTVEGSGSLSDVACGWAYEDPNDKEAKPIDGTYYVSAEGLKPIAGKTYTYICEFAGNGLVDPIIKIGTNTYETYEVNPGRGYCAIIPIGVVNEDGTITVSENSSKTTTSASDFTFTAPTTLTAGEARSANVTTSKSGMGTITVYYSSDNGGTWSTTAPSTAGTYKVAIDVTEGASYKAGTKITDDTWTFTLSSSTPSGSNDSTILTLTSFTKPSKLTSTPQTIQKNTTQISGKGSYDYGTGYWRCEDDNGEYTIGDGKKYDIYYGTPVVGKTYVYIIEIKVTGATDVQLVCDGKTYDCTKKESLYFAKIVEGTSDAQGNITESPVRDCSTSVHICADSSHSSEKHFYSTGVTYETSWDSPTYVVGREYESGSYSDYYNGSGNSMAKSNFGGTYAEGWYYQDGFYFFPCETGIPAISSATLTNVPTKYIVSGETYTVVDDEGNAVNVSDIIIGESGQYTVTTIKAVYDSFWKNVQVYMLLRPNVNYKFNNSTSFSINGDTYSDAGIISNEEEKSEYKEQIGITDIQIGDVCIICGNEEYSTKTKTSANDVEYNETNAVYTAKTTGIGEVTTYYKVDETWQTEKPTIKGTYEVGFSIAANDDYAAFGSSTNVKTETPVKTFTVPFSYGKFNDYSISGLEWKLSEDDKTLTIFKTGEGSGEMPDETPWALLLEKNIITTVIIEDGVTSISPEAFKRQTALTNVTITNTVTTINSGAFGGCTSLKSITIPSSVKTIDGGVFSESGLTSIVIPSSVTTIGEGLFSKCTDLASVTLPNSISYIPRGAFVKCTSLTSITLPTSVTSIEEEAFNSSGLTSIIIPSTVTLIEKEAFQDCDSLTNITFASSTLPTIQGKAFNRVGSTVSGTKTVYIANSDETARKEALATLQVEGTKTPSLPVDWVVALGHSYSEEWTIDTQATCTEAGSKSHHCTASGCTSNTDVTEVPALGHSYDAGTVTTQPTCTAKGVKTYVCTRDNTHTKTEEIDALGHNYSTEWIIDKAATCTEAGSKSHHCTACGDKKDVTEIAALGHSYGEWTIIAEATTTSDAKHKKECSVCHDTVVDYIDGTKKSEMIVDKDSDVSVTTPEGFDPSITVVVEVTIETEVENKISENKLHNYKNNLKKNETVGVVFEVKLKRTVNGVETYIQPSDIKEGTKIKVKMQIPEGIDVSKITKIIHVHSETDIEEIEFDSTKVVDGYYEIEIDRLSEFAFIYKTNRGLSAGAIVAIVLCSILLLLVILYVLGYFFLYRKGLLDDSSIKVIYVWLPRGDENKEELADNAANEEPKKPILTKEERQQKSLENKIKKLSATAMAYTAAVCIPVAEEGTEVIGIIYNEKSNVYLFGPLDNKLFVGDVVEVEDGNGVSRIVPVVMANQCVSDEYISKPFKNIIRVLYHGEVEINSEDNAEEILEEKRDELAAKTTTEEPKE